MRTLLVSMFIFIVVSATANANTFVSIENYELWSNTYGSEPIRIIPPSGTAVANPSGCTNSNVSSYMVSTTISTEAQARIYSTLLTALVAKHPVKIVVSGCQGDLPKVE